MAVGSARQEARTLATGLVMGESARWHDGRLWLCDWGLGDVVTVDAGGTAEVRLSVGEAPLSIDWLPDGRLVVVANGPGRIARREPDGTVVTHASLAGLSEFPWNEIVVDGAGRAYVDNIGFDMTGGGADGGGMDGGDGGETEDGGSPDGGAGAGQGTGFVVLVEPDGSVRQVADGLSFPNGMAITGGGSTLLVAESYAGCLTAYDIGPDGGLGGRRVWAAVEGSAPDGICLDAAGAAWFADVPNRRCVRVAEGGEVLDVVDADRGCFSCTLGGDDGRTLFAVAARWPDVMEGGEPTGIVVTATAPAPRAGRP
jgi:sugar lactone lactonase YvrE